ncbi:hypothetical protein H312_00980 [Anncaliia algerae PRA339]|uniref:Coatomer WD associated region domain-containing protein n=1 Tax=Anncaliia algerae PRA339 TaxID=1288291 RepID=A0A059F3Y3_9MICR|nr:hypothetical protein H312_00980 [Anncaliia algerae PRA339]
MDDVEENNLEMNDLEVYSVNISNSNKEVIFGGGSDNVSVICVESNEEIFTDTYNESIFYANFTADGIIVIVYDGTVVFYDINYHKCKEHFFNEEVSVVKEYKGRYFIGFESGRLIILERYEIIYDYTLFSSGILDILIDEEMFYLLNNESLLIYSIDFIEIKRHKLKNGQLFCMMNKLICVIEESILSFYTIHKKIHEIQIQEVECMLTMNNYIVLGGNFNYLMLIDCNYQIKKINLPIEGSTRIKFSNNLLFISSSDDKFCYGDFNKFKVVESEVGVIFDYALSKEYYVLAGEKGISIEKIESFE